MIGLLISPTAWLAVLLPLTAMAVNFVRQIIRNHTESKGYPLPPGPVPLPVIGNTLSLDAGQPWLTFMKWSAKYGDIMRIRLLDSEVIILSTAPVATELLEKRSQIYSDRPVIATVEPFGHDCNFGLSRYGEHWRLCRRIFHQTFREEAAINFHPLQLRMARRMVVDIHDDPEDLSLHFTRLASTISMSTVYDYEIRPENDPMISIVDNYLRIAIPALISEKTVLLKFFPFLLHVPDWFPGSYIKREAREAYAWRNKVVDTPYEYAQKRMETKDYVSTTMVSDHISRMATLDDDTSRSRYEIALKHAAATSFFGSVETTKSSLLTFTLAMVQNPRVWKRAQAEIDAVVGTDRLPEFSDRPVLPYIDAILRETLRWQPAAPIGAPHAAVRSDIYKDYYIPKGAIIIANTWAMSRDEVRYPDAEKFIPERFLDGDGKLTRDDPGEFVFGFGRRRCPGRHTASASLWCSIATMLATLDFNLTKDAHGNDVAFTPTFTSGIARHLNPFPCRLILRPHVSRETLEYALGAE